MAESETKQQPQEDAGFYIPVWVALVGLLVAMLLAIIIMSNVLGSLVDLVFPEEADVPLPDGTVEMEHIEDSKTADEEWLYGVNQDACQVGWFFAENEANCTFIPGICEVDENNVPHLTTQQFGTSVANCTKEKTSEVAGYSWEVMVSTGNTDYDTYFRVFLYKGR